MLHRILPVTVLTLSTLCAASNARAGEAIQVALGGGGAKSSWSGDASAAGTLKIGYQVNDNFTIYGLGRGGYALTDNRMLAFFSVGAQLGLPMGDVKPYARLSIAHQHEEPVGVVRAQPIGAVFGFADGIRHRGGLETAVGLEISLLSSGTNEIFASVEASNIWFYDNHGPHFYVGGGAALGFNYGL
jgi:hypothetical protein